MGTDIHMFMEVRGADGEWKIVGPLWPRWNDPNTLTYVPYSERDYELFAILADLRGYTPKGPISPARGLPVDMSEDLKLIASVSNPSDDNRPEGLLEAVVDHYGGWLGEHSYSYMDLDDLLLYDWHSTEGHSRSPGHWKKFYNQVVNVMRKQLLNHQPPRSRNDVRIVFGFDS